MSLDLLGQAESQMLKNFQSYPAPVVDVILGTFRRHGHLKPLLDHLSIGCAGKLPEQQEALRRCLAQYGGDLFLEAVRQHKSPVQVAEESSDQLRAVTEQDLQRRVEQERAVPYAGPERRQAGDRRSNRPGRREYVSLDFDHCRRVSTCRRNWKRRATDR